MKSVLISIKPKWCELIASGKKTIEVRKTRPKLETPFKCYIYATKQGRPLVYGSPVPTYVEENLVQTYGYSKEDAERIFGTWNGKVIGEFVCDKIEAFHEWQLCPSGKFRADEEKELQDFLNSACLSFEEVCKYRENLAYCIPLYGWHISELKIYDGPKELSEFRKPIFPTGLRYEDDIIKRAPQSWSYVEEAQHDD